MAEVRFVDTTLRDGESCIWGKRMTTEMMLPMASRMDLAGFEAMEVDTFVNMKMRVQRLKEEPWARIRLLARKVTRTPLMIISGPTLASFSEPAPPEAITRMCAERLAANGISRVQVIGFMNDLKFKVPEVIRFSRDAGLEVVIGLVFAISPRYTDEYYAGKTVEALALKPDRIYLKDPIGLLTPERIGTIIPAIRQRCGSTPLELHSHCTTGLAPLCYLEAIKLGVSVVHTGIPPLANGAAQPSVFNVSGNARLLGYSTGLDEEVIKGISNHFHIIAQREGFPVGAPVEYDHAQHLHQVPGGVISNLKRQLMEMKMGHRLAEVLEETTRVRKDLGYPMTYTPFSQFVVTQAAMNVVLGERYGVVPDEMIKYVLGYWGDEISSWVEPETRARILDRPRARELARQTPYEPTVQEMRQKLGGPGIPDDELLMRYLMGGEEQLRGLRPVDAIKEYSTCSNPLMFLIQELLGMRNTHPRYVNIETAGLKLELARRRD